MNLSQRWEKPVTGMVCLGSAVSPEGWATDIRLALSKRCLDFEGFVSDGVGSRSIGLRASAVSMSSGVKGFRIRKSFMLSDPSGLR